MKLYKISILKLLLLVGVFLSGCLSDTKGIVPPDDKFIFPVGVAAINDSQQLLVVNSNFDLQYNAGTLVAYDLSKLDHVNGVALDYDAQTGVFKLPPNTTFEQYCTQGQTAKYCNLSVSSGILSQETIRLGAYASDINITPSGDRALVPVRGEREIIVVDIANGANLLDCGEQNDDELRCDSKHTIRGQGSVSLPSEPYDVETMEYVHEKEGVQITETLGFATHRAGGEVSLFSVNSQRGDEAVVSDNRMIKVIDGVVEGASGLAVNPRNKDIYVVGQRDPNPHVAVLQVRTDFERQGNLLIEPWFSQTATIRISKELYNGTDARAVAVSPDGNTGFVITQNPPALLKIDLGRYKMVDMTTVCRESSKVDLYVDPQDPLNPLDDKLYAYVLCFLTGQVYIVDTDYMIPVIRKTGEGPQDITFDTQRDIAYIANFSDSTITMVQSIAPFNLIQVESTTVPGETRIVRIGDPDLSKGY